MDETTLTDENELTTQCTGEFQTAAVRQPRHVGLAYTTGQQGTGLGCGDAGLGTRSTYMAVFHESTLSPKYVICKNIEIQNGTKKCQTKKPNTA